MGTLHMHVLTWMLRAHGFLFMGEAAGMSMLAVGALATVRTPLNTGTELTVWESSSFFSMLRARHAGALDGDPLADGLRLCRHAGGDGGIRAAAFMCRTNIECVMARRGWAADVQGPEGVGEGGLYPGRCRGIWGFNTSQRSNENETRDVSLVLMRRAGAGSTNSAITSESGARIILAARNVITLSRVNAGSELAAIELERVETFNDSTSAQRCNGKLEREEMLSTLTHIGTACLNNAAKVD
ncbi:hypothetical protein C8F04DRAFT_1233179 [Mycena alexandri]|uniref:Uncharacterized protein n=1 Tax=Mycena alexandri TaxID=1745969 RepID=A0AAD6RZN5_9AGAR|nr:hypothetical protein C8F04DRAFT_1243454 [Mycena alexandri]KAJ7036418.1 hypothetical protein C8F04DRAFT_1233179 [Mycena alexandri]